MGFSLTSQNLALISVKLRFKKRAKVTLPPVLSCGSIVHLCIFAVFRTRPTPIRMWSWSVTATVQSLQVSWPRPLAARKLKSWTEWMLQCRKSDLGCVLHPHSGLFQISKTNTETDDRKPLLHFYIIAISGRKATLMCSLWTVTVQ